MEKEDQILKEISKLRYDVNFILDKVKLIAKSLEKEQTEPLFTKIQPLHPETQIGSHGSLKQSEK
jgi:carbamoylphosphate synthase large subunit